jgi:peptidoglycan/LPS O-acetylase OafA/YrhL
VTWLLLMMVLPAVAALAVDFRSRIAVAAVVACVLYLFGRARLASCSGSALGLVNRLAKISFSVFLVHFPVCLIVNAAFERFLVEQPYVQAVGMLVAWGASLIVGTLFFRWVEAPLGRFFALPSKLVARRPLTVKTTTSRG